MHPAVESGDQERRIPRLAPGWDPSGLSLTPAEGFLLSRIDGRTPWAVLLQIGGLAPEEIEERLKRWMEEGILVLTEAGELAGDETVPDRVEEAGRPEAVRVAVEDAIDADLDLAVDLQRRICEFEAALDQPYHALLGVDRGADTRAIKRAYFQLSKEFHPDRYFRRNIGDYALRLERIFKKIVEAYELLSDPATRAEIECSMLHAPPTPDPSAAVADASHSSEPQRSARREWLERLRRRFRIPDEVFAERRLKARQFFEAAIVSRHKERWVEAAASMRLAIAFDPWCGEYRQAFGEVQARVHQVRAAELLEKAKGAWDDRARHDALLLYEEALHYRPSDPEVNDRAAQLAIETDELDRAREYAETACEVEPDVARYRVTLARVFRRQGLVEKARGVLEEALRLDPEDSQVSEELRSLRRRGPRGQRKGGKK
jgi:curved DNA-binding protein CbpA